MEYQNVKGTHDVILKEANDYKYIVDLMSEVVSLFDYHLFHVPVIENANLFQRGVGASSDIVRKEMYTFLDKGERLISLRPEFTASIIRSFNNNKLYATMDLPIKAYYHGPVFRYERPQLGRYRQFDQFGIEILGTNSLYFDAEAIILGYTILKQFNLEDVTLKINSLGDETSRNNYRQALKDYFKDHIDNMCNDCKSRYQLNPLRILDCKVKEDQEIIKNAPKIYDYLTKESKERFEHIKEILDENHIPYEVDDNLVRGLDYYSQIVFEFHYTSKKGFNYGAIGAGGHYSNLINELGGPKDMQGVGFSFGVERLYSILKDDDLLLNEQYLLDVYVASIDDNANLSAFNVSNLLRIHGLKVDSDYTFHKPGSAIKIAIRKKARYLIFIGLDEIENNVLTVKDLSNQEQIQIKYEDLINYFYDKLGLNHKHIEEEE